MSNPPPQTDRSAIEPSSTTSTQPAAAPEHDPLGPVERYLALWILICIAIGLILAHFAPSVSKSINDASFAGVSIPIGVCLFLMMYPALINLQLAELKKVVKYPKPLFVTFVSNWVVAPAISAALAYGMLSNEPQLQVAVILLGASPCTAMVLVWNLLADGNQEQNVVNTSLNTVTILALYAPIVELLTGVQGIAIDRVPLFISVAVFIGIPLIVGLASKTALIRWKGADWFVRVYKPIVERLAVIALFTTLIVLFALNGEVLLSHPIELLRVSAPLLIGFVIIVALNMAVTRWLGFAYREAVTTVIIGSSSHFEIAIATAVAMYGTDSKAALGTTMGLFWEVPVMLLLVQIAKRLRKRHFWREDAAVQLRPANDSVAVDSPQLTALTANGLGAHTAALLVNDAKSVDSLAGDAVIASNSEMTAIVVTSPRRAAAPLPAPAGADCVLPGTMIRN